MNSLKINNKVRTNIITKTTSLALASILITSMFVGLIPLVVMPAAAANSYLSVSSTKIGDGNAIKVTVTDSSLTNHPTIVLSAGTNSTDLTAEMVKAPSGEWFVYIASNDTSLTSLSSAPPSNNGTNGVSAANAAGAAIIRTVVLTSDGTTASVNATTLTLTYSDRSETETLTYGETALSSATPDREEAPPSSKVYITFTDETTNLDPTTRESKTYTIANTVNLVSQAAPTSINMTETAVDSGIFRGTLNTSDISSAPTHGQLLQTTVTDDDSSATTIVSVNIRASDGVITTQGTLTHATSVNVTLTDADRNLDSLSAETLTATDPLWVIKVNATVGTALFNVSDLSVKETGVNTGIFNGTISVAIGNVTALAAATNNSIAVNYNVTVGDSLTMTLRYTDPVQVTSNHYSEGSITLSQEDASIAFDATSYLPNSNGIPIVLTLTEPDANDNAAAIELLTVTNATYRGLLVHSSGTTVGKLNFTETDGTDTNVLEIWNTATLSFIETGINTGVFELRVDIQSEMNGTRASGWTITASYVDVFDTGTTAKTVTATATIGGTTGTIALDRTTLPLSPGNDITVKVTLTDADENTNIAATDSTTISIKAKNATNQAVNFNGSATSVSVTVTETGQDTGIFTGSFTYNVLSATGAVTVTPSGGNTHYLVERNTDGTSTTDNVTGSLMIGGTFNATYSEPLATGNHIDSIGTITASTASLSVTPSGVNLNETVVFTLTDNDLNDNMLVADTVSITIKNATASQTTSTLTLTETGVNTGIFNGSKRSGDQSPIESPSYKAGDTITATYTDPATDSSYYATGFATAALTGTSTISSNDATITLDATSYGPYSVVKINITDPDLALDTITSVDLSLIKTSSEECRTADIVNPVELSDGTFQWTITLNPTATVGDCDAGIKTTLTDTITVYFVDAKDAAGTAGVILTASASIAAVTGSVVATPSAVLVGEFLTVTVTDSDQNKNSDVIESVNVIVTTDTWSLGQNVTVPETGIATGIFEVKVKIVVGIPATSNEIRGTTGDTITVSYKDRTDAAGEISNVVTTNVVGVTLNPLERVPAGTPSTVDISGNAVTPTAGTAVAVESQVCNDDSATHTFTYIVQVKDANGVVVSLSWVSGTLTASTCGQQAASWTPASAGEYTVETFVWDSILTAVALSPITTITVTVV